MFSPIWPLAGDLLFINLKQLNTPSMKFVLECTSSTARIKSTVQSSAQVFHMGIMRESHPTCPLAVCFDSYDVLVGTCLPVNRRVSYYWIVPRVDHE